jgi:ABC-type phosphate transport system substrate-binding protein
MKIRNALQILTLAGIAQASTLFAGDVKIIANPSVTEQSISSEDLKNIFLQTKNSLGSAHVLPVLHKAGPVEDAFCTKYVGKNDGALQTYYRSLVFTGRAMMPKALETDEEIVEYVSKTKGAIGFVSSTAKLDGVVTLTIK